MSSIRLLKRGQSPQPSNSLRCILTYSVHVTIKEQLSITLQRDGGLDAFELKGDLDLRVSEADKSKIKLTLANNDYSDLQFKQHPNVAKFAGSGPKVIALKDASRSFPVGQGLGVLRWRMTSKDESRVPLTGTSFLYQAELPLACGKRQWYRGRVVDAVRPSSLCGHAKGWLPCKLNMIELIL